MLRWENDTFYLHIYSLVCWSKSLFYCFLPLDGNYKHYYDLNFAVLLCCGAKAEAGAVFFLSGSGAAPEVRLRILLHF